MLDLIKMSDKLYDLRKDKEEEKRNSGEKDCRMSFTKLSKEIKEKTNIHISNTALWEYENPDKDKKMSIENLWAIADYYHVSTDYLLGLAELKTSDVKIIEICEYTGLSENAVKCIKKYNNFNKENHDLKGCITALDKYLSSDGFWGVLINTNQYFDNVKKLKKIQTNKINPNIRKQIEIQEVIKPNALYRIQKNIIDLTEEIGKKIYTAKDERIRKGE